MRYHLVIFSDIGQRTRSLGASMIKHALKKRGYNTKVINYCDIITEEQIELALLKYVGPKTLVGISTTFFRTGFLFEEETEHTMMFLNKINEMRSKMKFQVIIGGPAALEYNNLIRPDYTLTGYAENQIGPLMDKIFNLGISKSQYIWDIKNCDHIWDDEDHIQQGEVLPLETSRGCIFKCKYCRFEMIGKKRGEALRPLENIKNELVRNYELYGVTNYMLMDDTFNDDVYKMDEWTKLVSDLPFKIQYVGYLRADLLWRYPHVAENLYATGMKAATFGIETLHPKASSSVGKGWSGKHAKDFMPHLIHNIFGADFVPQMNFIVGLPYEEEESIYQTYEWLDKNKFYSCLVYPLYAQPYESSNKAQASEFDKEYEKYGYTFPEGDNFNWSSPWMNRKEAERIASVWYENYPRELDSFRSFALLNYGVSIEEAKKNSQNDYYTKPEYNLRIADFTKKYFDDLLK